MKNIIRATSICSLLTAFAIPAVGQNSGNNVEPALPETSGITDLTEDEAKQNCPVAARILLLENKRTGVISVLDCERSKKYVYAAKHACNAAFGNIGMNTGLKAIFPLIKNMGSVDERLLDKDICHAYGLMQAHCPASMLDTFDAYFNSLQQNNILGVKYTHPRQICTFENS